MLNVLLFVIGMLLVYFHDISHHEKWISNYYKNGDAVAAALQEPLSEKDKSLEALASVQYVINNDTVSPAKGSIPIYLKKDSSLPQLSYGSQLIFNKPLQPIKNSGNPGSFDYQGYCAFQDIYH